VPGSGNAVYITIEQIINRHAKSRRGIRGFSRNFAAYYRWSQTQHTRASYVQATFGMADISSADSSTHIDTQPANIATFENKMSRNSKNQ
jgi:hypothetical protein